MQANNRAGYCTQATAAAVAVFIAAGAQADNHGSFSEALTGGKVSGDFRLRFEDVGQDNGFEDASALTLRSRLGYTTGVFSGFSATLGFEDSRIVFAQDDFSVGPTGFKPGEFSVIADPETTEIDQGFIQYKADMFTAKLGRQVITHDGHRFIGHVGWRQDRQTFDAATFVIAPSEEFNVSYSYVGQRNRIFAEAADLDSKDHLLNLAYKTGAGTITAYAYLLEVDNDTDNGLDTYGLRFTGSSKAGSVNLLYTAEYATQESESGAASIDTDYIALEGGLGFSWATIKLGYESLGSDSGNGGFATPLATLHKFNGWADQFLGTPAQGLIDTYASIGGKLLGGAWLIAYHDFSADEDTPTIDDFGSEIDIQYTRKFAKHFTVGLKYADYSAGDADTGKVDTDKLWLWVGAAF